MACRDGDVGLGIAGKGIQGNGSALVFFPDLFLNRSLWWITFSDHHQPLYVSLRKFQENSKHFTSDAAATLTSICMTDVSLDIDLGGVTEGCIIMWWCTG